MASVSSLSGQEGASPVTTAATSAPSVFALDQPRQSDSPNGSRESTRLANASFSFRAAFVGDVGGDGAGGGGPPLLLRGSGSAFSSPHARLLSVNGSRFGSGLSLPVPNTDGIVCLHPPVPDAALVDSAAALDLDRQGDTPTPAAADALPVAERRVPRVAADAVGCQEDLCLDSDDDDGDASRVTAVGAGAELPHFRRRDTIGDGRGPLLHLDTSVPVTGTSLGASCLGLGASANVACEFSRACSAEVAVKTLRGTAVDYDSVVRRELAFAKRALEVAGASLTPTPTASSAPKPAILRCDEPQEQDDADTSDIWCRVVKVHRVRHDAALRETTITMELMRGGSVAQAVAAITSAEDSGDISAGRASTLLASLADAVLRGASIGLGTLHERLGVLHRDVKPENLLLSAALADGGVVKVSDFGSSYVASADSWLHFGPEPASPSATGGEASTEGVLANDMPLLCARDQAGSVLFMSPERVRGDAHGPASDVWSLGLTLLQIAHRGRYPLPDVVEHGDATTDEPSKGLGGGGGLFWSVAAAVGATESDNDSARSRCAATVAAAIDRADAEAMTPAVRAFVERALQYSPIQRPHLSSWCVVGCETVGV